MNLADGSILSLLHTINLFFPQENEISLTLRRDLNVPFKKKKNYQGTSHVQL